MRPVPASHRYGSHWGGGLVIWVCKLSAGSRFDIERIMRFTARDARAFLLLSIIALLVNRGCVPAMSQTAPSAAPPASSAHDVSLGDYRQHLQALVPILDACALARDTRTCDPALVGPDDRVPVTESTRPEKRLISYDWLRALLLQAQLTDQLPEKPDATPQVLPNVSGVRPPRPTTSQLLKQAHARLEHDLAETGSVANVMPVHDEERDELVKVLAGREFRSLDEPSARDTILEKIGNAINQFFYRVASFSAKSRWIGRVVVWGFVLVVCVGLIWGLLQLERRWRIRLVPEQSAPAAGAASARDWQLWLEDASRAAAERRWREAIHFVYWAAISRLESKRLWPADRARTPREYLALVAEEDPRRTGLASLSGSFERIWYGGRVASERDYRAAEQLATNLIDGGASAGAGSESVA
jgi:hypothetical protein